MIDQAILHYVVLDQMGAGGMGVVYRALDTRLGRHVALKFLPEPARADPTARARLLAEAQAAARLDHPNIGVIHAIEEVDDRPFIVMALYQGENLRARIDRADLGVEEATDIAVQAARGLARAHAAGVVHRDVKPDNLFLTGQGGLKVLDFGLAKLDQMDGLTSAGAVVGTLEYMSPEQIRGQAVDSRTDVWALGVVLYEMLTRVSPFKTEGGMTASILKIIKDEPEPVLALCPAASPQLAAVVDTALMKDREVRYASAQALLEDLEAVQRGSASFVPPLHAPGTPPAVAPAATAPAPARPAAAAVVVTAAPAPSSTTLAPAPVRNAIPTSPTPLVGRTNELAILATNLADPHCRILTLFGPGGTGKTRLVLQAATNEAERSSFPDGVAFVPLDSLDDPELIPTAIARVLGLELQPNEAPLAQVQRHVADKRMLIVLDNYEHVMDGAHVPSELVQACAGLKVIVTSRERLNLDEEWVLPLPGLSQPPPGPVTLEEAERHEAVQLFVQRARKARLDFSLDDEDPAHVCGICRLVGGSPLGVELAAAWVKMMPCEEILREIQASLDFLESSSRNVSARHRSVRACFEYSWTLLSPKEQDAFRRLATFHGSFTREAAAQVAGASLPILSGLVDKSLLHAADGRYDTHPLLRQYAAEKLAEAPEAAEDASNRHGAYFLEFVRSSLGRNDELSRVDGELVEVLAALQRAHERRDGPALVTLMRLLAVDGSYYAARGSTTRSLELLQAAVVAAKEQDDLEASHWLLSKLGNILRMQFGDHSGATETYAEALTLAERLGDAHRQAIVLSTIGQTRFEQGEADAGEYLEQAHRLAQEHDDVVALNHVLQHKGYQAGMRGDWEEARSLFSQALEVLQAAATSGQNGLGSIEYQLFMAHLNLSEAEIKLGDHQRSLDLRQHALKMALERDNRLWEAYAVHDLGEHHHQMGDRELAQEQFTRAMVLWRENHVPVRLESLRHFMHQHGYDTEV